MPKLNYILICCSDDSFAFKDLVQIIIAIATLAVAILTYKLAEKISFKKTVKDRQFDVVCQFIKDFSATLVTITYQKHDEFGGSTMTYLPNFYSSNFKNENADIFKCENFMVQEDAINNFKFIHLIGNPFLPLELSAELRKLWIHPSKTINNPLDEGQYVYLANLHEGNKDVYSFPKEFKNFGEFYNYIIRVIQITNSWLDKHEASDLKFRD